MVVVNRVRIIMWYMGVNFLYICVFLVLNCFLMLVIFVVSFVLMWCLFNELYIDFLIVLLVVRFFERICCLLMGE